MLFVNSARRRLESFQIVALVGSIILLWKICYDSISWPRPYFPTVELSAANATLGFEAILVVAPNKSTGGETVWRQEGILRAAELTGLNIDIPPQPNFTETEILASIAEDRRKVIIENKEKGLPDGDFTDAEGKLRLGHLHVLKHNKFWDGTGQLFARCTFSAFHEFFSQVWQARAEHMANKFVAKRRPHGQSTEISSWWSGVSIGFLLTFMFVRVMASNYSSALILEDDADWDVAIREQTPAIANAIRDLTSGVIGPWGFNWDYLALGHCGAGAVKDDKYRLIQDPTTGPAKDYKALWGPEKELKNGTRFVHETTGTVCTFGYAVSRHGAKKMIDHLSTSGQPLDIDYASFCNGGGLNCYAVTPEIIHHHQWTGHKITSGGASHGALEPGETSQKFTLNVKHSARCNSDPDLISTRPSGTKKELIECQPTGMSKDKYSTK